MPWIWILRDALAIVVARSLVKALLAALGAGGIAPTAVDFGVLVVAFCAIGYASPAQRLARLGLTAVCSWAIVLVVALVRGATAAFGFDLVETLFAAAVGGGASLAIARFGAAGAAAGGGPEKPPGS